MGSCSMLKRSLGIIDEIKEEIVGDDNQTNCLHKDTICQDNLCFYKQQILMTNNGMLDCLPNGMITIHNLWAKCCWKPLVIILLSFFELYMKPNDNIVNHINMIENLPHQLSDIEEPNVIWSNYDN